MAYTKADLKHDLAAMGLTGNETILIHSSMKSIGPVEGGADTVLDAWMEFFAEGLLLLPTHTWRFINEENRVFDVRHSPCCVGILPELFRMVQQLLSLPFDPWMILYGLILIVMMRFRPQGIWGKAEK